MKIISTTPQKSLDKSLLRFRPKEADFRRFKEAFATLLGKIDNKELEDNQKTHVHDFLRDAFYRGTHEINSKGKIDLVVHLGSDKSSPVGLIVEAKSPGNKAEMLSEAKPNAKALHELVLYYMRERIEAKNDAVKYLIATNINEWFIFSASDFDEIFHRNTKFRKKYEDWRDNQLVNSNTDHFYNDIAKPFVTDLERNLECTHFDLREYAKPTSDKKLIALYKLLSPYHLLKTKFEDDSNTLDKKFYTELLHIIGLEEYKEKSKTLIRRKSDRTDGTLIEKAIAKLESEYFVFDQTALKKFGDTKTDQIYNAALELCIVWINRILFLKLLEAQLVGYHEDDSSYKFLKSDKVNNFNELATLFHDVLNCPVNQRQENVKAHYPSVPYLNSSLFDFAEVEIDTIRIHAIDDNGELSVPNSSILRKLGEKSDSLPTLEYLFRFLEAYDFASEGKEEIQSESRSLINASVLGKVFEKINGYKDGSIYTPGFITMYMCRQAIRLAVVQKFKDETDFDGSDFDELKNFIGKPTKKDEILQHNKVIDSLKICDPAVGSGHFLVSALNEILAIKSELNLFADEAGVRFAGIEIAVAKDELVVTDDKNVPFEYKVRDGKPVNAEMQRLQSTLFLEKQKLIENCLFGVDINPNSVKICRLRLWIELLKNAYYKSEPGAVATGSASSAELETLPNIDINIKQGNSLISRFALDTDLAEVLKQVNFSIDDYRSLVHGYKETRDRESKRGFETRIRSIKEQFKTQLFHFSPERVKLKDLRDQLTAAEQKSFLFGEDEDKKEKRLEKIEKLKTDIQKQTAVVKAIEENAIYENAFEWRFEFPEILDFDGKFLGFDVVIGNPPYINVEDIAAEVKVHLKSSFGTFYKRTDLFSLFLELSMFRLARNHVALIIPSVFLNNLSYRISRDLILSDNLLAELFYVGDKVFPDATVDTTIIFLNKEPKEHIRLINALDLNAPVIRTVPTDYFETFENNISIHVGDDVSKSVISKIYQGADLIVGDLFDVFQGIVTGNNPAFIFEDDLASTRAGVEYGLLKPLVHGRDISKWEVTNSERKILYLDAKSPIDDFPGARAWLEPFRDKLSERRECQKKVIPWFSLQWARDRTLLDKVPKILVQSMRNERLRTRLVAAIDNTGIYGSQGLNFIVSKGGNKSISVYFLLALLNSSLINFLFSTRFLNLAIKADFIRLIPLIRVTDEKQRSFTDLVNQILDLKKSGGDTTQLENRIDEMVYELYELTDDEKDLIREST